MKLEASKNEEYMKFMHNRHARVKKNISLMF